MRATMFILTTISAIIFIHCYLTGISFRKLASVGGLSSFIFAALAFSVLKKINVLEPCVGNSDYIKL